MLTAKITRKGVLQEMIQKHFEVRNCRKAKVYLNGIYPALNLSNISFAIHDTLNWNLVQINNFPKPQIFQIIEIE